MKLLLHGAINGSNFGDCLFAKLFYERLKQDVPNSEVFFFDKGPFGISNHLRNYLSYNTKLSFKDYKKIDALIFISGGYFGEGNKSLKNSVIRFFRYLVLGLYFVSVKKPIYVVGVEVGPFHSRIVMNATQKILKASQLCIVRNIESDDWCKNNGISSILTVDSALSVNENMFDKEKQCINLPNKKHIFLHVDVNEPFTDDFLEKVVSPILNFIHKHDEYDLLYGCDGLVHHIDHERLCELARNENIHVQFIDYQDPSVLCGVLCNCDIIITRKLHVGILSSVFGKSVISIPAHEFKTKRFYTQIGCPDRCVLYKDINSDTVRLLLDKYYDKPIVISNDILNQSKKNLELLISELIK